jgi:hypothetical protein
VPAGVHGDLRTIYHFFLLNFWFCPASVCRELIVISPKKIHPAADRQGAKGKVSKILEKARGDYFFLNIVKNFHCVNKTVKPAMSPKNGQVAPQA